MHLIVNTSKSLIALVTRLRTCLNLPSSSCLVPTPIDLLTDPLLFQSCFLLIFALNFLNSRFLSATNLSEAVSTRTLLGTNSWALNEHIQTPRTLNGCTDHWTYRSVNILSYFIYREDYVHSFLLQATRRTLVLIRNLISNWTFFKSI